MSVISKFENYEYVKVSRAKEDNITGEFAYT